MVLVYEINACPKGLHSIKLVNNINSNLDNENFITICQENVDENIVIESPSIFTPTIHWLRNYFFNKNDINQDKMKILYEEPWLALCPDVQCSKFALDVYKSLCRHVPYGQRCSYSQLAQWSGHPNASRAVGSALKSNPLSLIIPCHRVVQKSGEIGKYGGCLNPLKQWLLDHETNNNMNCKNLIVNLKLVYQQELD